MKTNPAMTVGTQPETRALRSTPLSGNAVPTRVLLAPWGTVESTAGTFVVDEESAREVIAAFEAHGTDLPIDYEHQTLGGSFASPSGKAPAAGWIKKLCVEPGVGVLADIEWTDEARTLLAGRQYRYLSPVALIRRDDRKLIGLHSAALTNKPAIVGMTPIVNRQPSEPPSADEAPLAVLCRELNLPLDCDAHGVLLAASQRITALQRAARERQIEQRITDALRSGKLIEAQRGWAATLAERDEALFEEWFRSAPVVVSCGAIRPPAVTTGPSSDAALAAKARAEFRAEPLLARLTSEEAYVADTLARAGH